MGIVATGRPPRLVEDDDSDLDWYDVDELSDDELGNLLDEDSRGDAARVIPDDTK